MKMLPAVFSLRSQGVIVAYNEGLLKKAASGVLAICPCSRTAGTFRAQKMAVVLLDGIF
ncbi:MAG: hypothetical protein H0X47_12920 [Nitrospirales bacterium]|nr:hypothetical protein [Nitrospirales bacterium]